MISMTANLMKPKSGEDQGEMYARYLLALYQMGKGLPLDNLLWFLMWVFGRGYLYSGDADRFICGLEPLLARLKAPEMQVFSPEIIVFFGGKKADVSPAGRCAFRAL